MLRIRLSRIGKKKKPMYRLIISERARDPYGRALEILGSYNPFSKELNVKKDRVEHWLAQGAQMSATVNNLLLKKDIIKGTKLRSFIPKKKKKAEGEGAKPTEAKKEAKAEKPAGDKKEEKPAEDKKSEETKEEVKKEEAPKVEKKEAPKEETKKEEAPKEEK